MKKHMRIIVLLFLILSSCELYIEDTVEYPCGYEELPYLHEPSSCQNNPWTFEEKDCCTWIVDEFYSECIEMWCHNEHMCSWQLNRYSCYPI